MKVILVLLDGIGDRSYATLNHRTPLGAAATPNLDRLAYLGSNGLLHPGSPGQCLPSEMAHYLLLGYDPESFAGRGLLEAVGESVAFDERDVLCLAHLSGVCWQNDVPILVSGRDDLEANAQELEELFAAITPYEARGIGFRIHQTRRNDAVLIMSGKVSPYVSDSDPMIAGRAMGRISPLSRNLESDKAQRTAKALNDYLTYCHRVLTNHGLNHIRLARNLPSINFLATHRCGRRINQEPFDQRWGLAGMLIASGSVYAGLAHELGLTFVRAENAQDPGEDLRERVRMAVADASHDFVHVHTKAADEAAHKGDPEVKVAAIAALDRGLDELVSAVRTRDDLLVVVTADHSTPSVSTLIHSGEPVPVTLVGPTVRRDRVDSFDEVSAAAGCLGLLRGRELMLMILNCTDRSALVGHRLGAAERAYTSNLYEPFRLTD